MDCSSLSPTGTLTGALSACPDQCALAILDCNVAPAWDMYDTTQCNMEHALFGSTVCEYVDISGFAIEYRVLLHKDDRLWGEDPNASLSDPFITKAIFDPAAESTILNAWGISYDDTMQYLQIPKTMFTRDGRDVYRNTPELAEKAMVPKAGDVIKLLYNNRLYEITDVGDQDTVFNAKKFIWEMILRPFRFSEQSAEHREFYSDRFDDPFETITEGPTGQPVPQKNEFNDVYGDNDFVEEESDKIDDYRDVIDPDKASFGY